MSTPMKVLLMVAGAAVIAFFGFLMWTMVATMGQMNAAMGQMSAQMTAMGGYMGRMDGTMAAMAQDTAAMNGAMHTALPTREALGADNFRSDRNQGAACGPQLAAAASQATTTTTAAANNNTEKTAAEIMALEAPQGATMADLMRYMHRDIHRMYVDMRNELDKMEDEVRCMTGRMVVMSDVMVGMGGNMGTMAVDMNRGTNSFTSPSGYMWNMLH